MTTKTKAHGPFTYSGPVGHGATANPSAHGGVCFRDERDDGSTRLRNVNGTHQEIGPWTPQTQWQKRLSKASVQDGSGRWVYRRCTRGMAAT